jgi:aminocarboxymuconate-semialdehyde decarboxylase
VASSSAPARSAPEPATAVIDLHAHAVPRAAVRMVDGDHEPVAEVGGRARGPLPAELLDATLILERSRAQGITHRVLSLPPYLFCYDLPADEAERYCAGVNEGLADFVRPHSGLMALGALPLQDPPAAVRVVEAAAGLGLVGVAVGSSVAGRPMDGGELLPVYEAVESLGLLVFIHPTDPPPAPRVGRFYLRNVLFNPTETALAAAELMFGGVLDRFPRLKILLSHGGGSLPFLIGRFQRGHASRAECGTQDPGGPRAYLRRFHYDTIVHDDQLLRYLIRSVGEDRVVIGTDLPFAMGDAEPLSTIERALPAASRPAVLHRTATDLLARAAGGA